MTTRIRKTVKRVTLTPLANYGADRKLIVVSIQPGDVLGFRLLRSRREYLLSIGEAMRYAIRLEVNRKRAEKIAARKTKKG
jgi:hypothetical protein